MENWIPIVFVISVVILCMILSILPEKKVYQYKDKHYTIRKQYYKALKHPTTREWVDFIEYRQIENKQTYYRETEEFFDLFEEI